MNLKFYDIVKEPIITEKSMQLKEAYHKYTFKVAKTANKIEIKNAIEALFNVKVLSVNTINVAPKTKTVGKYTGKTSAYKKAIVKLAEGNKIDAFEI